MNLLFIFSLLVNSYMYNPNDWLELPALSDARNVTVDPFYIYVIYGHDIAVVNKFDKKLARTATEADGLPVGIKLGAYDPETGVIWLLTPSLLVSYNPNTRGVYSFQHSLTNLTSLGVGPQYVYLATSQAALRFSKLLHQFEPVSTIDPQTIWYGARSPYKPRNYIFLTPYYYLDPNFRRYDIIALVEDQNTLWVTTNGYGIFAYDLFTKVPRHYRFGPAAAQVFKIFTDPTGLWLTNPDYISFYNPKADTWSYYDLAVQPLSSLQATLVKPPVYDLIRRGDLLSVVWKDSAYWLGTTDGLYFFEPKSEILIHELSANLSIDKLLVQGDSAFLASDRGLYLFHLKNLTLTEIKDPDGKVGFGVSDIAQTRDKLFFACSGGIVSLDTLGNWEFRQIPGMDLTNYPGAIAAFDNLLFVATGGGLIIFDEDKKSYQRVELSTGLLLDTINALAVDNDYLWIGTKNGISRFAYKVLFPARR